MKILLNLFCLLSTAIVFAGNGENNMGARSAGLANISILQKDIWSSENNPANLAHLKTPGAGFSYESGFFIKEFAYKSAVLAYPMKTGAIGISVGQFGYNLYNENKIGFAYGLKLSDIFSMGLQLNYYNTQIGDVYGNSSGFSGNLGLMADINEELSLAVVIINPSRLKLTEYNDERYPSLIKTGLSYTVSEKVKLLSELVKNLNQDLNSKFGLEYLAHDNFSFRLGYANQPSLLSFGFGLKLKDFQIDLASGYQSKLGFSPQVSLSYVPKSKSAE